MKTVIIYDDKEEPIRFAVVDGDLSHLDRVYFNELNGKDYARKLIQLIFIREMRERLSFSEVFPVDAVKDGAKVIVCGFIP